MRRYLKQVGDMEGVISEEQGGEELVREWVEVIAFHCIYNPGGVFVESECSEDATRDLRDFKYCRI